MNWWQTVLNSKLFNTIILALVIIAVLKITGLNFHANAGSDGASIGYDVGGDKAVQSDKHR